MSTRFIVGLYHSAGFAKDACNRLRTEGVPDGDCAIRVLHDTGPVPESMEPELEALSFDPMVWGDVRRTYADYIRNGETAVLVRAQSQEDVEFAADIMRLYAPIVVEELTIERVR